MPLLAQAAQELVPVDVGQAEVEDDQVGLLGQRAPGAALPFGASMTW